MIIIITKKILFFKGKNEQAKLNRFKIRQKMFSLQSDAAKPTKTNKLLFLALNNGI
jgi:hypothetical protein